MIIGIAGPKRSGKNTAAEGIKNRIELSFARPLKNMLLGMGLMRDEIDGHLKEVPLTRLGLAATPRQLMQTLGTEWGRQWVDKDLWVKLMTNEIESRHKRHQHMVVTDVRFDNEAELIRSYPNGRIIHIERPGLISNDTHTSERLVSRHASDCVIVNDSTPAALHAKILEVINS